MKDDQVVTSTLENIPGMDIEQHFGMVTASLIMVRSSIKKIIRGFKRLLGGEMSDENAEFQRIKEQVIEDLRMQAKSLGANAIVCLRVTISSDASGLVEVLAYGTAVKAVKF